MSSSEIKSIGLETLSWSEKNISAFYIRTCDSTNSLAKSENLKQTPYLFLTDYQTAGRGRNSNSWISPEEGSSLLSSWVFHESEPPQPLLSLRVGLALYNSLQKVFSDLPLSLKAPNDIYLKDKKLAGLLIEVSSQAHIHKIIIGPGMNVLKPASLPTATYLSEFTKVSASKWREWLSEFLKLIQLAIQNSSRTELSEVECSELKTALNQFPLLTEKYEDVLANGSLKTSSRTIHWSEL